MKLGGSLPHSQEPATFLCPEHVESNPCFPHPNSLISILVLSSHIRVTCWTYGTLLLLNSLKMASWCQYMQQLAL